MRIPVYASGLLLAAVASIAATPGCATGPAVDDPTAELQDADVVTRTAPNGDVISEYRVAGQLQVVKVTPVRGPTYYLMDRDRDGIPDNGAPVSPVLWKLFEWD
ncbi:MAG: DUF2782 domain-containing protein [Lysobacter sp.]|nr:DUF2782 domain-containing protein [Lysobacter sp.]MDQ3269943.1 DUF2782 domain-containing protein [Pseudomonadota bacterium]